MKYMNYIVLSVLLISLFEGCSTNDIDYALARASGNKPATFFRFTSPKKVDEWYFKKDEFVALPPKTYRKDWQLMGGWNGAYIYGGISFGVENKDVNSVGLKIGYSIVFSTSHGKVGEYERAVMRRDEAWFRNNIKIDSEDKLWFENRGKENYVCQVMQYTKKKYPGNKYITYECYKFDPTRTKYQSVQIELIYHRSPKLPAKYRHLANVYTFSDLKRRAKRTLDSLYIKKWW